METSGNAATLVALDFNTKGQQQNSALDKDLTTSQSSPLFRRMPVCLQSLNAVSCRAALLFHCLRLHQPGVQPPEPQSCSSQIYTDGKPTLCSSPS